jgi:hypothetical protein
MVMDTFSAVDDLSQDDYYRKHFYVHYDGAVSLSVAGAPCGTITTVQSESEVYPIKVVDIKKIFFAQQALPQQVPVPASSAVTLQLPADIEKEVVAKDGINKLKLFHICGTINPESTSFGTIMEIVISQPHVQAKPVPSLTYIYTTDF